MPVGQISRFSDQEVLKAIGKNLLAKFFAFFSTDLAAKNIPAPDPNLPDPAYFQAAANLFYSQLSTLNPQLPSVSEALHAILELSEPGVAEGHRDALAQTGFHVQFDPGSSPEHAAVKLWLALPSLLTHLEQGGVTLQPLRTDAQDALDPAGIKNIHEVSLTGIETTSESIPAEICIRKGDDLFQSHAVNQEQQPIPATGRLTCAAFRFVFSSSPDPSTLEIRPPHLLRLDRLLDALIVGPWMARHGYLSHTG